MARTPSPVLRAVSTVATFALALTGLSVLASAPAAAAPASAVVYDSIPDTTAGSYPSLGFLATSTTEFGDYVKLSTGGGVLNSATVNFTSWSCQTSTWNANDCASAPGATFTHDVTLNVYDVDKSGANPAVGALIGSVTQTKAFPYRPSADPTCVGGDVGKWRDTASNTCRNGFAANIAFDLTAANIVTDDDVIVSVAYATNGHGVSVPGPYDSLNVSLAPSAPTVGTDVSANDMFVANTASSNLLVADTDWAPYNGLLLELTATPLAVADPTADVTVRQVDVKSSETALTYLSWHEGKNNVTPAYSVKPDGLHLGDGAASTIIKGTPITEVTKAQLRALIIAGASANVVSISDPTRQPTFQLPIRFGAGVNDGDTFKFTTLQTSLSVGNNTFSLDQSWRTSRTFGPYLSQQASDTLGNFLDEVFKSPHVAIVGFGVQSDKPAVISNTVWNGTRYTFAQPVTSACTPTAGPVATNLDANGWTFLDTRAEGHNVFTADGLHIYTDSNTSLSKAAGYIATDIALKDAGVPQLNLGTTSGGLPSVQLVTDFDNDGIADGILVGETIYGNDYWLTNGASQFVKDAAPSHGGGYGSANHGTLDQWLESFPDAKIKQIGYSLGSGILGSAVIESIEVGCLTYSFTTASASAPTTTQSVNEFQISSDASPYTGWHEGYSTNTGRSFSVESDGLNFGDPQHSQPLFGLATPISNPDLEAFITSSNVDVTSGNVSYQLPIFYGNKDSVGPNTPRYTTLRIEDLPVGQQSFSVTDKWLASSAILNNAGATVVASGTKLSVADWNNVFAALGPVNLLGFAVQADAASVVKSVTANGVKYVFGPYTVPAVTPPTVPVWESDIALTETALNYSQWHEGASPENATPAFTVTKDGLTLGIGAKSQILKGLDEPLTTPTAGELIAGAEVVVTSGWITYQVPVFYGPTNKFGTLHSTSLTTGTHTFTLDSQWRLSKSIPDPAHPGTNLVDAFANYPLWYLLDTMDTVQVIGFGVQTDAPGVSATWPAVVESITFNQTEYDFAGEITGEEPTISGSAAVGETLTLDAGTWAPDGVTLSYQWQRDGVDIDTATAETYTLTPADFETDVTVVVTGTKGSYTPVVKTSNAITVGAGSIALAPVPAISGTAKVGSTLTAATGTWPAGTVFTYQWKRSGAAIPGATSSTYKLTAADFTRSIKLVVTGTPVGYSPTSRTSATVKVQKGTLVAPQPTIAGAPKVGSTLKAIKGSWSPSATFTYEWRRSGVPIAGATSITYKPTSADLGRTISVVVRATQAGYKSTSVGSAKVTVLAGTFKTAPLPTVSGGPSVGSTLTATAGTWSPSAELTYQWRKNGKPIVGATSETYTLTAADLGRSVSVVVTGTQPGYTSTKRASMAVMVVQ